MPQFNITPNESKQIATATFHKADDYKVVRLKNTDDPILLHRIHADGLIKKGAAEEVKGMKFKEENPPMQSTPIDDK